MKAIENNFILFLKFLDEWRHIAAYVYLLICLFDFLIMPLIYLYHINVYDTNLLIQIKALPPTSQVGVIQTLKESHIWTPLTLQAGGFFHIAFGAILGVSAWSKGKENIVQIQQSTSQTTTVEKDAVQKDGGQ